jgi:hypothetical protein
MVSGHDSDERRDHLAQTFTQPRIELEASYIRNGIWFDISGRV